MNQIILLQMSQNVLLAASAFLLCMTVWQDVATRLISNRLTVAIAVLGLALRLMQGDVLYALPCMLLIFIAAFSCWQMRWIGGGDAKLITAASLLVPAHDMALQLFAITLAGGALAMVVVAIRPLAAQHALPTLSGRSAVARIWRVEQWRLRHGGSLPYAAAITAGTIACLLLEGWTP